MTGCDDAARGDVQATVAAVIRWVAEEDACLRAPAELVRRRGTEVGEAEATKHPQLVVAWRGSEEQFMRRQGPGGTARPAIQQVRRRVEGLCPVRRRSSAVDQQSSQAIVNRAQDTFGLAILLRRVRAREAERDPVSEEVSTEGVGVILTAIIRLQSNERETELSLNIRMKGANNGENFRLGTNGKCPYITSEIIQEHNIVFVP